MFVAITLMLGNDHPFRIRNLPTVFYSRRKSPFSWPWKHLGGVYSSGLSRLLLLTIWWKFFGFYFFKWAAKLCSAPISLHIKKKKKRKRRKRRISSLQKQHCFVIGCFFQDDFSKLGHIFVGRKRKGGDAITVWRIISAFTSENSKIIWPCLHRHHSTFPAKFGSFIWKQEHMLPIWAVLWWVQEWEPARCQACTSFLQVLTSVSFHFFIAEEHVKGSSDTYVNTTSSKHH